MSEAEDRKAKAARAKALVRVPVNKLKLPPFSHKPTSIAKEEAASHKVRKESPTIEDVHPVAARPPSRGFTHDPGRWHPERGRRASLILFRNSATEARSH